MGRILLSAASADGNQQLQYKTSAPGAADLSPACKALVIFRRFTPNYAPQDGKDFAGVNLEVANWRIASSQSAPVDTSDCKRLSRSHFALLLQTHQNSKSIDNCNCLGMPALFGLVNPRMGELSGP
jgi:hypothetical protein